MTTTFTPSLRLSLLTPGDPSVKNAWGLPLNTNDSLIDSAINGTAIISVAGLSAVTLSVANGAPDQSRELVQQFTGAPSGACTVSLPNVPKYGYAQNLTTGGFNIILTSGAGTTATIPPDGKVYAYSADGATNVSLLSVGFGALNVLGLLSAPTATLGALTVTGTTSPLLGIVGAKDGGNAIAGAVGEYVSVNGVPGGVSLPNNLLVNVLSIALSPGDWDVSGLVTFTLTGAASNVQAYISSGSDFTPGTRAIIATTGSNIGTSTSLVTGTGRISISVAQTIFLAVFCLFQTGTCTVSAFMQARRMR